MLSHAPRVDSRADLSDAMMQAGCWAQTADRIAWEYNKNAPHSQGFRSTHATMQALIRLGMPFRLRFIEKLDPAELAQAKAVLVPFCTHLAETAAGVLGAAAARGRLIVFAHRGEFDETGKPREKPVLRDGAGMIFFQQEAAEFLKERAGRQKLGEAIGEVFDVRLSSASDSVERTWLRTANGGVVAFLINWDEKPAAVQVRLPGGGKCTLLDTAGNATEIGPATDAAIPVREARVVIQPR